MKMLIKAFTKKLFGVKYEGLLRSLFVSAVLYMGLHNTGFNVSVAPVVLYLTAGVVTAGVMWKSLNSNDLAESFENMIMMPFPKKAFVSVYVIMLGIHTVCTRLLVVLAVIFAVQAFEPVQTVCCVVIILCAVLLTAAVFTFKKLRILGFVWAGGLIGSIFMIGEKEVYMLITVFGVSLIMAVLLLARTDDYVFYDRAVENQNSSVTVKSRKHNLVWVYLIRYIRTHKNFIFNSLVMWAIACILPLYFKLIEVQASMDMLLYFGFGIVSINTPIAILISGDPDLERDLRCLPNAGRFFTPYGLFVFTYNVISTTIFLVSWEFQQGGITAGHMILGVILSVAGAVLTMILEYFFPVRNWKIESDLWHHPRKYIVPAVIVLMAFAGGALIH